ncbi:MAG: hypothetical protein C4347_00075, partial [Patescibacteria group bacterium]
MLTASSNADRAKREAANDLSPASSKKCCRATRARNRRLAWVLVLTGCYMLAEAIGGWWTGSLALLADAGHMLTDVAALALALFAAWFSARPANSRKTYGYYRLEILAAFTNGISLALISALIIYEAYQRL